MALVPSVTIPGFLLIELVAAFMLVVWVFVRFPHFGPRSLRWTLVACLAGLAAPKFGLVLLPLVLRFPEGLYIALFAIVLPVFVVMFLAIGWLMRATAGAIGGPRGGHRIRNAARSHS